MKKLVLIFLITNTLVSSQNLGLESTIDTSKYSYGVIFETLFLSGSKVYSPGYQESNIHGGISFFVRSKIKDRFSNEFRIGLKYISISIMGVDFGFYGKGDFSNPLYLEIGINGFWQMLEEYHNGGMVESKVYWSLVGFLGYNISNSFSIFVSYSYLFNNKFGYKHDYFKFYPIVINSIYSLGIEVKI
ncbi:MAG: hypothetical protein KDC88_07205 [Ignavibacteriae bacterium]|nr:hypothetical protein [Ignavibacteriota bacterium]MCB9208385.1 hypothetical protein [Ignavibacteriales bacterium]MCB9259148.1 hypothetical protein [Ignavibacteriales bacterium]